MYLFKVVFGVSMLLLLAVIQAYANDGENTEEIPIWIRGY
jgi:hypothetical protein